MGKRTILWSDVESSNLAAVGYDPVRQVMYIRFRGGAVYRYRGVEPEICVGLLEAESKGRYFHREIRGQFPYKRIG